MRYASAQSPRSAVGIVSLENRPRQGRPPSSQASRDPRSGRPSAVPAGRPGSSWDVVLLNCGPERKLGVTVSTHDCRAAWVTITEVRSGDRLAAHNAGSAERAVQEGDRIVRFNGQTAPADIISALQNLATTPADVTMTIVRPHAWTIFVPLSESGLGVDFLTHDFAEVWLTVHKIAPGSALDRFNELNPDRCVKEGDKMMLPNLAGSGQDVLERIHSCKKDKTPVELLIER